MKVISYYTKEGRRSGLLVSEGRKWTKLMMMSLPIKVTKVLNEEQRNMTVLDYKMSKAKRHFKHAVNACYGSLRKAPKSVREVLR